MLLFVLIIRTCSLHWANNGTKQKTILTAGKRALYFFFLDGITFYCPMLAQQQFAQFTFMLLHNFCGLPRCFFCTFPFYRQWHCVCYVLPSRCLVNVTVDGLSFCFFFPFAMWIHYFCHWRQFFVVKFIILDKHFIFALY